jgi:hypothetical protein
MLRNSEEEADLMKAVTFPLKVCELSDYLYTASHSFKVPFLETPDPTCLQTCMRKLSLMFHQTKVTFCFLPDVMSIITTIIISVHSSAVSLLYILLHDAPKPK